MKNSVLSLRVPPDVKADLEFLSQATKRSKAYLAAEALEQYVRRNAWKARELQEAKAEADQGIFISHDRMKAWAKSLGTEDELPAPAPDVFPD
jgi:RHH-type rel operon transcriptional repressor/antitoxin RelB